MTLSTNRFNNICPGPIRAVTPVLSMAYWAGTLGPGDDEYIKEGQQTGGPIEPTDTTWIIGTNSTLDIFIQRQEAAPTVLGYMYIYAELVLGAPWIYDSIPIYANNRDCPQVITDYKIPAMKCQFRMFNPNVAGNIELEVWIKMRGM